MNGHYQFATEYVIAALGALTGRRPARVHSKTNRDRARHEFGRNGSPGRRSSASYGYAKAYRKLSPARDRT